MTDINIISSAHENYQSQYGQDRIINETYFKDKKNGVFLDIGAHDGKTLSNTYYFEKFLSWNGMCIEPTPKVFKELQKNRDCILIEGCAWNEDTIKKFRVIEGYSEMLNGLIDAYHNDHEKRIQSEVKTFSQTVNDIDMKCYNITNLLIKNNLTNIDFLSIDIEGGELEVLMAIDFSKINVNVILVENCYNNNKINNFLNKNNYEFIKKISIDDLYVNKNFK